MFEAILNAGFHHHNFHSFKAWIPFPCFTANQHLDKVLNQDRIFRVSKAAVKNEEDPAVSSLNSFMGAPRPPEATTRLDNCRIRLPVL